MKRTLTSEEAAGEEEEGDGDEEEEARNEGCGGRRIVLGSDQIPPSPSALQFMVPTEYTNVSMLSGCV
jgi:hypothetical protein